MWTRYGSANDSGNTTGYLNVALKRLSFNNRPASEFDNFYTPDNSNFYAKSPYFKLDAARNEVRLLKVYPKKKPYSQHIVDHPEWKGKDNSIYNQSGRRSAQMAKDRCKSKGMTYHSNLSRRAELVPFSPSPEIVAIACELVDKIPLSRVDGKYHALSYCAGSPKNVSPILIDGIFFNAFENLEHAIEHTLHSWNSRNPDKELLLWVDQICINQNDQTERSNQVGLMRDIYQRSQGSFISLSTHSHHTNAFNFSGPSNPNGASWIQYGLCLQGQTSSGLNPFEDIELFVEDGLEHGDKSALTDLSMYFESLYIFLSCPWWSRAWIYQEFVMTPRAYFIYDSNTVSWAELSTFLGRAFKLKEETIDDLLSSISQQIEKRKNEENVDEEQQREADTMRAKEESIRQDIQQLEFRKLSLVTTRNKAQDLQSKWIKLSSADRKLVKEYSTYVQEIDSIQNKINSLGVCLKNSQAEGIPKNPYRGYRGWYRMLSPRDLEILSIAQTSIARVKELLPQLRSSMGPVASLMKAKTQRRKVFELKELLKHSRKCQASDPRDRIYAFLGLANRDYGIVPKYTCENTIVHILIDVARRIITTEGNLGVLEHVSEGREKLGTLLPSWVPDWTSNDAQPFTQKFQERIKEIQSHDGNTQPFRASRDETSKPEFIKDPQNDCNLDIKVKAIFVEALDDIDGSLYDESLIPTFRTLSGSRVHTSRAAAFDDEVWVLYGARYPVVLRPEQGGRYSFLGEALVCKGDGGGFSDVMYGGMVDLASGNEALVKFITIV